jgi:hypothetical protein
MTRIGIFFVAVVVICAGLAAADTNYSKTVELPPLRASFEDLQSMLDKVSSLANAANKNSSPSARKGSSNWEEELGLGKGEQHIKMSGHRLQTEGAKIPSSIDSFEYNGRVPYTGNNREEAPISRVAIKFHDFARSITVEGRSSEQVELLVSALRDDLSKLSPSFLNSGTKPFLTSGTSPPSGINFRSTVELPPIRVSFEDLQSMLDKVSSIVSKGSSNWEEGLELRKGEKRVKMSGHHLEVGDAKIPSSIDSFEYNGRVSYPGHNREEAPITQVAITFHDYDRSISVEGRSPEQVELLVSALRDDLSQLSSPFGNFGRIFSTWSRCIFAGKAWLG